ncbi:MAG: Uma2 family endonuclease [Symploca sp. SIO1B1]|nr:Uma2 family endonuclease [Symploca sp. SIO1A3]NER94488.1 Uma2 family endonuclease [Symploca sp. SIO1B1]
MTHTPVKLTFEQYLEYDDGTDNYYELWDGELRLMPPESELNGWMVEWLQNEFAQFVKRRLVRVIPYELQVLGKTQNRFPDLVVLRKEHIELTRKRRTITINMPPPQLVVEVVSPYRSQLDENYKRDYIEKRQQYEQRGIPEYWIVDPIAQLVTVLMLVNARYQATEFSGNQRIVSRTFPELNLTAKQILEARE